MATPPVPRARVEQFLKEWKEAPHDKDDDEALESADVIREMLDRIKKKCPEAAEACDEEMLRFERHLMASLIVDATKVPEHQGRIPRSDTTLIAELLDDAAN